MSTAYRIPIRPRRAAQSINVTLDGRRFRIDLDWNGRIQRWTLSLFQANGDPILQSKAVVLGADLLGRTRHKLECPQGALILVDLQDGDVEADLDSLGVRHVLRFWPLAELS